MPRIGEFLIEARGYLSSFVYRGHRKDSNIVPSISAVRQEDKADTQISKPKDKILAQPTELLPRNINYFDSGVKLMLPRNEEKSKEELKLSKIFGVPKYKTWAKHSQDEAISLISLHSLDQIGYLDSQIFLTGEKTDFNFEYLNDFKGNSELKREALFKLFGDSNDLNKFPRYLHTYAYRLSQAARLLARQLIIQTAKKYAVDTEDLLIYALTQIGKYESDSTSYFERANKLKEVLEQGEIQRIDSLFKDGAWKFCELMKSIASSKDKSTEEQELFTFNSQFLQSGERKDKAKIIDACLMLAGQPPHIEQTERSPYVGELVSTYSNANPNKLLEMLDKLQLQLLELTSKTIAERYEKFSNYVVGDENCSSSAPTVEKNQIVEQKGGKEEDPVGLSKTGDFKDEEITGSYREGADSSANETRMYSPTLLDTRNDIKITSIEDVFNTAYSISLDLCKEIFEKECLIVVALEKDAIAIAKEKEIQELERHRLEKEAAQAGKLQRRQIVLAGAGLAGLIVAGAVGRYFYVKSERENERLNTLANLRTKRIEYLRDEITREIEAYRNINFNNYVEISTKEVREKKEKGANPNEVYFYYLCYYLERVPTEEELVTEIGFLLKNKDKISAADGRTLDPDVEGILSSYIEKSINADELADSLLNIFQTRLPLIPHVLINLMVIRAIKKNEAQYVPGDLKDKQIHDLRSLFKLGEWSLCYHLQPYEIDGRKIPPQQIAPTIGQLLGSGTLIGVGGSFLYPLVEAKWKGTEPPPLCNTINWIQTSRIMIETLRKRIENKIVEEKERHKNSKLVQELINLQNSLNIEEDLDNAEVKITPMLEALKKERTKTKDIFLGLGRCIVLSSELESLVANHHEQVKKKLELEKPSDSKSKGN